MLRLWAANLVPVISRYDFQAMPPDLGWRLVRSRPPEDAGSEGPRTKVAEQIPAISNRRVRYLAHCGNGFQATGIGKCCAIAAVIKGDDLNGLGTLVRAAPQLNVVAALDGLGNESRVALGSSGRGPWALPTKAQRCATDWIKGQSGAACVAEGFTPANCPS